LENKVAVQADKTVQLQHEIEAARVLQSNLKEAVSGAKQAESEMVEQLMRGYEPVLKEFYYRIQPHPQFNDFRVDFKSFGDAGEVYFKVVNVKGEEINPSVTFSSGQASALAVSLFLALNSRQNWTDLQTVLIDDPIQYLDDVSMLGLIDLLRSWADTKQLILSVHDKNLVPLLARKFRGTHKGTLVRTYYFEGLSDQGPVISAPHDDVLDQDDLTILKPE
jgi:exonuclease SbcC